jgi:hypothetical protein
MRVGEHVPALAPEHEGEESSGLEGPAPDEIDATLADVRT